MRANPPTEANVSFDEQASAYEARAGLPEAIGREVAALVRADLPPQATVVDVGAGTGTIGRHLLTADIQYRGLDVSPAMLAEFARGAGPAIGAHAALLQVDADGAWPIPDRAANAILFSRSAHLLRAESTVDEVLRIAAPGCRVFVGRVRRPPDSAGEQLRHALQDLLRARALPGRNGERAKRDFLAALEQRGAVRLPERVTSAWSIARAPIDSITHWRSKAGLVGRAISDPLKDEILRELEEWARAQLGDLETARPVAQHYQLEGVQLAG